MSAVTLILSIIFSGPVHDLTSPEDHPSSHSSPASVAAFVAAVGSAVAASASAAFVAVAAVASTFAAVAVDAASSFVGREDDPVVGWIASSFPSDLVGFYREIHALKQPPRSS